jgi:hypothetical protein
MPLGSVAVIYRNPEYLSILENIGGGAMRQAGAGSQPFGGPGGWREDPAEAAERYGEAGVPIVIDPARHRPGALPCGATRWASRRRRRGDRCGRNPAWFETRGFAPLLTMTPPFQQLRRHPEEPPQAASVRP